MISRLVTILLLAGTTLAENVDSRMDQIVQSYVSNKQFATSLASLALGGTVMLQSERKEITLDPKVLSRYVGLYQMAPGVNMLVTLDNNQLVSQMTGQGPLPIFPQSETMFFPKVVD